MKINTTLNLNLIIGLLLACFMALTAVLLKDEESRFLWFNVLSAFTSLFTLGIAILVYNKLDAKKLAFSKRTQAVDDLVSELVFKNYTFAKGSLNSLDPSKLLHKSLSLVCKDISIEKSNHH